MPSEVKVLFTVEDQKFKDALKHVDQQLGALPAKSAAWTAALNIAQQMISKIAGEMKEWVDLSNQAELAQSRLAGVLQSTGFSAGKTTKDMNELAEAIQNATRFDDDAAIQAMAQLASTTTITGEHFNRTIELGADMAELFGTSLPDAVNKLAKALDNPVKGMDTLRRSNIMFTSAQRERINTLMEENKLWEAQGELLDAIAGKIGTVAESAAETAAGKLSQLANQLDNIKESLGDIVKNLAMPAIEKMTEGNGTPLQNNLNALKVDAAMLGNWFAKGIDDARSIPGRFKNVADGQPNESIAWNSSMLTGWPIVLAVAKNTFDKMAMLGGNIARAFGGEDLSALDAKQAAEQAAADAGKRAAEYERTHAPAGAEAVRVLQEQEEQMKKLHDAADKYRAKWTATADALKRSLETPFERAQREAEKLNDIVARGFVDSETRARAMGRIREDLLREDYRRAEEAATNELSAREEVLNLDKAIAEATSDKGFKASIESLTGMWERIATGAASRNVEDKTVAELKTARDEAARRWIDERRLMEETNELLRAREEFAGATFR